MSPVYPYAICSVVVPICRGSISYKIVNRVKNKIYLGLKTRRVSRPVSPDNDDECGGPFCVADVVLAVILVAVGCVVEVRVVVRKEGMETTTVVCLWLMA